MDPFSLSRKQSGWMIPGLKIPCIGVIVTSWNKYLHQKKRETTVDFQALKSSLAIITDHDTDHKYWYGCRNDMSKISIVLLSQYLLLPYSAIPNVDWRSAFSTADIYRRKRRIVTICYEYLRSKRSGLRSVIQLDGRFVLQLGLSLGPPMLREFAIRTE